VEDADSPRGLAFSILDHQITLTREMSGTFLYIWPTVGSKGDILAASRLQTEQDHVGLELKDDEGARAL
jgi:hypothetical protein